MGVEAGDGGLDRLFPRVVATLRFLVGGRRMENGGPSALRRRGSALQLRGEVGCKVLARVRNADGIGGHAVVLRVRRRLGSSQLSEETN